MALVMTASLLGYCISVSRLPQEFGATLTRLTTNPLVYLLIVNVLLLVVGCFMEALAAMLVLIPILVPPAIALGIDPLQFGLVFVLNLMIGTITPPVGVVLYVTAKVADVPFENRAGRAAVSRAAVRGARDDHVVAAADDVAAETAAGALMRDRIRPCPAGPPPARRESRRRGGCAPRAAEAAAHLRGAAASRRRQRIAALRHAGVGRRDTVAVVLPNGPELAAVSIAIASGARCAPLNPAFGADEFRFYLSDLQARGAPPGGHRSGRRSAPSRRRSACVASTSSWTGDAPAGTYALGGDGRCGCGSRRAAGDDPPQPGRRRAAAAHVGNHRPRRSSFR